MIHQWVIPRQRIWQRNASSVQAHHFLERFLFQRLGQAKVRGDVGIDSQIDQLAQLYELLQQQIAVLSKPATEASSANELSMSFRARNLLREKTKEAKTVLTRLQTLRNKQGVAGMNSRQQADFLQELKESKNSKDFARRAKTATPNEDVVNNAIEYFISMLPALKLNSTFNTKLIHSMHLAKTLERQ